VPLSCRSRRAISAYVPYRTPVGTLGHASPVSDTAAVVLAALGGGLASTVLTTAIGVVNGRRDEHARWVSERRDAYVGIIKEIQAISTALDRMHFCAAHMPKDEFTLKYATKAAEEIRPAVERLQGHSTVTDLLAPTAVLRAVAVLSADAELARLRAYSFPILGADHDPPGLAAAGDAIRRGLVSFTALARSDLGIRGSRRLIRRSVC
jgi:hypothetical protein